MWKFVSRKPHFSGFPFPRETSGSRRQGVQKSVIVNAFMTALGMSLETPVERKEPPPQDVRTLETIDRFIHVEKDGPPEASRRLLASACCMQA